jgi:hypothetical protein
MGQQLKIVAGVLLVVVVAFYAWWYWPRGEVLEKPEVLAQQALSAASLEQQEQAAAQLVVVAGKLHKTGPRNPAREPLVQVFKESKAPSVRVAAIRGLTSIWDYDNLDAMLEAMNDPSAEVQVAAKQMILTLLYLAPRNFPPATTAEERQAQIEKLRERWEVFRWAPGKPTTLSREQQEIVRRQLKDPEGPSSLEIRQRALAEQDEKK